MKAKSEKCRYDGKCGCSVYEACPRCIGIYEQGKKDADGIKATLLIERDKKTRKQTLEEVKDWTKAVWDKHKKYEDMGQRAFATMIEQRNMLEQEIKEASK